jgi:hypothetical protein
MMCAWAGCTADYEITGHLPEGWHSMIVFHNETSPIEITEYGPALVLEDMKMTRDAVLCPEHAAELESLLKDIGNRLRKTEGSA